MSEWGSSCGTVSAILHSWSSPVDDLVRDLNHRYHDNFQLYKGLDGLLHCALEQPVPGDSRVLRTECVGKDLEKCIRQVYDYA
jgi:hypothetical protein